MLEHVTIDKDGEENYLLYIVTQEEDHFFSHHELTLFPTKQEIDEAIIVAEKSHKRSKSNKKLAVVFEYQPQSPLSSVLQAAIKVYANRFRILLVTRHLTYA